MTTAARRLQEPLCLSSDRELTSLDRLLSLSRTSNAWQVVGGDIKRVGETLPISDPDGVVDLVKVCL